MTKDEIILAQQARIEQLRETLQHFALIDLGRDSLPSTFGMDVLASRKALSTPDDLSALRAHDEKLLAPYQWQPIETAPKDGTAILISNGKGAWVAKYKDVYQSGFKPNNPWLSLMLNKDHIPKRLQFGGPTHWMPLPSTEAIEKGGV